MIANGEFIRLSGGPGATKKPEQKNAHDRIVVIGGGGTGATTLARFLHLWGAGSLDITLIEPDGHTRLPDADRQPADGGDNFYELVSRYGIRVLVGHIDSVDSVNGILALSDGTRLPFDRLVVAPGVELSRLARAVVPDT